MLAVASYSQDYIDECRAQMEAQLAAYEALVTAVGASAAPGGQSAVDTFAPLFFNNLVLVLDNYFVHRTRAIEGKDGNPLNEVRILVNSILCHDRLLSADKSIKYKPETAVLKLRIGDEIRLDAAQFVLLFKSFFTELERRFT